MLLRNKNKCYNDGVFFFYNRVCSPTFTIGIVVLVYLLYNNMDHRQYIYCILYTVRIPISIITLHIVITNHQNNIIINNIYIYKYLNQRNQESQKTLAVVELRVGNIN